MRNYVTAILATTLLMVACKPKEKEEPKKFISVLSLIEKQVAHIDTSLYSIRKYVIHDSLHIDSSYVNRENFREVAKEFLEIPDLSDPKVARRYKEETRYDPLTNWVIVSYIPVNPEKEDIQKQEIIVIPNAATGDKVNNIIIERLISNKNGYLSKKMYWQTDKNFLITTTSQKPGEPEIVTITKVIWDEYSLQ